MKNPFLRIAFLITIFSCSHGLIFSQEDPVNQEVPKKNKIKISGGEKFDFIFNRGFLLPTKGLPVDSAQLNISTSGSYSFGFGYALPLGTKAAIRLEPRFTWHLLDFKQVAEKTFPSDSGNVFEYEKARSFYLEVPIGIRLNLARNVEEKLKFFAEGGFTTGILLSGSFKRRTGTANDRYTEKWHYVWGLNNFRYGPYARIGTNWIAFSFMYRMSDVFDPKRYYKSLRTGDALPFPKFPKVELGVTIIL